jgi:AraC-like DNA-binding protein
LSQANGQQPWLSAHVAPGPGRYDDPTSSGSSTLSFSLSIYGITGLALGAIGLFATTTLVMATRPGETRPWFLCLFLAGLSISILMSFLEEVGALRTFAVFLLCTTFPFISSPALFIYARQTMRRKLRISDAIHLLPLLLGLVTSLNWALDRFDLAHTYIPGNSSMTWTYALYASSLTYMLLTLHFLRRYKSQLHQNFSQMGGRRLLWIRGAAWGVLLLISTDLILGIVLGAQAMSLETTRITITSLLMALIFSLSLQALKNPATFISELDHQEGAGKALYATSGLDEGTLNQWADRLNEEMLSQKLFLENDLTLPQLARRIRIKSHHLSQVLNQQIGKSFYDYVNEARIQYARELLIDTKQSVLDVAFACGYNNKASFYKAFSQYVRTTPLKYRKLHANHNTPEINPA